MMMFRWHFVVLSLFMQGVGGGGRTIKVGRKMKSLWRCEIYAQKFYVFVSTERWNGREDLENLHLLFGNRAWICIYLHFYFHPHHISLGASFHDRQTKEKCWDIRLPSFPKLHHGILYDDVIFHFFLLRSSFMPKECLREAFTPQGERDEAGVEIRSLRIFDAHEWKKVVWKLAFVLPTNFD